MNKKRVHTPEGVRDVYGTEYGQRSKLKAKLNKVFASYGYEGIRTPGFEFFDVFNSEKGTVSAREMFKFFDREGNTLVLRPDVTPSIARCIAKYFNEENMGIRLSYAGNVFLNNSSYQLKLKETCQLGAELVNDASVQADITYEAENINIWDDGDTEYTEHEIYNAVRGGTETFSRVPADASKKMDDVLMESIEPFHYQDAVPFQSAYLAGYVADRYDVDKEERMQRAEERMKQAISNNLQKTVTGYTSVKQLGGNFQFPSASYQYALYPVWILNTTWRNEKFVFAMNGQTGKLTGDLPLDKKAFRLTLLMRGGIFSIVFIALLWLLF